MRRKVHFIACAAALAAEKDWIFLRGEERRREEKRRECAWGGGRMGSRKKKRWRLRRQIFFIVFASFFSKGEVKNRESGDQSNRIFWKRRETWVPPLPGGWSPRMFNR